MAMNADNSGIDLGVFHVGIVRDRIEHAPENIRFYPVAEAFEDGVPVPKRRRQVSPWTAGPSDPQHSLDKEPGISSGSSGVARRTQAERLHLCPLSVRQAEPSHRKLLSELGSQPP